MGIGTAQRLAPKRAGQEHVRSVARLAGNFARVIRARRRVANELIAHGGLLLNWSAGVLPIRAPNTPLLHHSNTPTFLTDTLYPYNTSPRPDGAALAAGTSRYRGKGFSYPKADRHRRESPSA